MNTENINKDKFWESLEYDHWIYINDEILKMMGYTDIISGKKIYNKLLIDYFNKGIDYKYVNNKEFNNNFINDVIIFFDNNNKINSHNRIKHLILSPECFKQTLMLIKTKKTKEIRDYYLDIEKKVYALFKL